MEQVIVASEVTGLTTLGGLARDSIEVCLGSHWLIWIALIYVLSLSVLHIG